MCAHVCPLQGWALTCTPRSLVGAQCTTPAVQTGRATARTLLIKRHIMLPAPPGDVLLPVLLAASCHGGQQHPDCQPHFPCTLIPFLQP